MLVMDRRAVLKKRIDWKIAGVLLTGGLAGCGTPHISLPRRPVVLPRPTLNIISHGTADLNPLTTQPGTPGYLMDQLMFNSLVNVQPNGTLVSNLASSWSTTNQNRRIVLTLDPHAIWWDGRPVTASDVAWSYHFYTNPASRFPGASALDRIVQSVVALGPTKVVISLKVPDPGFLSEYASQGSGVFILPSFLLDRVPIDKVWTSRLLSNPVDFVGTGPFRPTAQTAAGITLSVVPRYFQGTAHISKVVLTSHPPARSTPETADLWLNANLGTKYYGEQQWRPDNRAWVLIPNFRVINPGLADTLMGAVYRGVDRTTLAHLAHGSPANGPVLPSNWSYYPGLQATPSSAATSGSLTPSGVTQKSWTITVDRGHPRLVAACRMISRETRLIGLHFACHVLPRASYRRTVGSGTFQWALADTRTSAQGWFYRSYHGGQHPPVGSNIGAYNNPLVNQALDSAAITVNPSAHLYDLYRVQTALQKSPPGVFLVWPQYAWSMTPNLVGIQDNPYVRFYQPQTWQISRSKVRKK